MYTIWRTGHPINERVVTEFRKGTLMLSRIKEPAMIKDVTLYDPSKKPPPSVSYGFLRGTERIFQDCRANGVEFWEIDKGYFKPGHFNGFYRISYNGIRANCNTAIDLPADRFNDLGIAISPWRKNRDEKNRGYILLCPPTQAVCELEQIDYDIWLRDTKALIEKHSDRKIIHREKNDDANVPIQYVLDNAYCVVTYNSNIAIQALMGGIPAFTLDNSQQTPDINTIETDGRFFDREKLFRYLAYCQFTLAEFAKGKAWETAQEVQKYGVLNAA